MKCKRKKAELGAAAIAAILSAVATGIGTATQLKQAATNRDNEMLKQRYDTMSENDKNSQLFAGNLQSFYNNQDAVEQRKNDLVLPTLNNSQFRCGGRKKAQDGTIRHLYERLNPEYPYTEEFTKTDRKQLPLYKQIPYIIKEQKQLELDNKRKNEQKFFDGKIYNSKTYKYLDSLDNRYFKDRFLPTNKKYKIKHLDLIK